MIKVRKIQKTYYFPARKIQKEWWEVIKDGKIKLYDNFRDVLKEVFKTHATLYKEIANIPNEILSEFHPNDDDFCKKDCVGYEKFIKYCLSSIDDKEAYQKINDILVNAEKITIKTETKIISEFDVD